MKSNAAYKEEDELPKPFKGSLLMYGYDNKTLKQLEAEHASPSPFDTEDDGAVHEKSGRNTVNINSGGPLTGGRRRLSAQLQHATNAKKREADAKKKKEASGS